MKFSFKVKDKNDKGNKLVGIAAREENIINFAMHCCKQQVKSSMATSSKSKLMATNTKASFLIKMFTDQSNANHSTSSKEMKIFAEDFSVLQSLENEYMLTDFLLDCKSFYVNYSRLDEFFDNLKDVIMEQADDEEKSHNEWEHCSDSLSIRHLRDIAKEKCSLKATTLCSCYLVYQFVPTHPRRKHSKQFNT